MDNSISIALCGDVLISRRIPRVKPESLTILSNILKRYECVFGNLETTIHRKEGYPEAFPGGSYAMADPLCLRDLKELGFNLFNTANNHSMDYGHGGLMATLRYLDNEGIPHAGTGRNLAEASSATYFECKNGRVAMVGVTSSFHDSYLAGPQNLEMEGRPGVSPLRHRTIYELDDENYEALSRIAQITGINNYHDQARKEGYLPPSTNLKFGQFDFIKGPTSLVHTYPLDIDLMRTIDIVKDAKLQSDIVIVSIHSHQFSGNDKHNTPEFISIFAKKCIDCGADIIVCHGPHVMRGIDSYKNGIIFYGLGNFILELDTRTLVGEEEYLKAGTSRYECPGFSSLVQKRSKGGKVGLIADDDAWRSFFAGVSISDKRILVTLYPIALEKGYNGGLPIVSKDTSIIEKVLQMSGPQVKKNIEIDVEKGKYCMSFDRG